MVYVLLTINIYLFFAEEWAAAAHRFTDQIGLKDVIEGFASSIDTCRLGSATADVLNWKPVFLATNISRLQSPGRCMG